MKMSMCNGLKFHSHEVKLDFNNVLIVPKRSTITSRKHVDIERTLSFRTKPKTLRWKGVPIISSNMDTVTNLESFKVFKEHNYMSCFPKHFNSQWVASPPEELKDTNNYMLSCGINDYETLIELVDKLSKEGIDVRFVCVDIANGYLDTLGDVCKELRRRYPSVVIAAGNVVTPEGVESLIRNGANMVKVGVGSGAVCITRLKAGVGYPQLSAVLECVKTAHTYGAHIISDGGIVHPADFAKAFAAGSSFVMAGSVFAGHTESPGELLHDPHTNEWYKLYYGMASEDAVNKYNDGLKNYRSAEGKKVRIPHKGPLSHTIHDINGGIRSACTYTNSYNLEELYENTEFILVSQTHNDVFK
jgi:GMP reductase